MAGYSSSSSLPADVFLSFRGEDTRKSFVCHLHAALERQAVNAYIDSHDLRKGDHLSDLLDAITNSKLSIVVFSENYASSTWCLKELVQILKCKAEQNQIMMPVFYQVDPSHVRKQEGSFAQAFAKHERDRNNDNDLLQDVKTWRSALTEATNSSGWDSRTYKDDAELIKHIVEDVSEKLIRISPRKANDDLVGMDSHLCLMRLQLCLAEEDVRVVGIWGMGGIGKTTIAEAVYDEIGQKFHHSCFLRNVREGFAKSGEEQMKRILLESLRNLERLGNRKVLLVLDDVDKFKQIETLIGKKPSFGGGSRIIVTTRHSHVLNGFELEIFTYEPELLSNDQALGLFRRNAFGPNGPSSEYDDLSSRAIKYAHGLPLALKVLAGFLKNKSVVVWEDELEKLEENPSSEVHLEIQNVLRTNIDALDRYLKNIFLDIACFFRGMHEKYVGIILDRCGFYARSGLRVLVDRALITISKYGGLEMHDLLQEIGWEIVHSESPKKPWKRTRLWSYEDVRDVLTHNKATNVESIMVELSNSKDIYLNVEAFVSMTNLRLLKISYPKRLKDAYNPFEECTEGESWPEKLYLTMNCKLHLNGVPKFLSHKLRVLVWHGCPLKFLPFNFDPKNLVDLDMRCSHIEQLWEGTKEVKQLISINLSCCEYLTKIPFCTKATKLEKLILKGCISLLEVHPSISAFTGLVFLNLQGCTKLKSLPSNIHMKSLKTLVLSNCSNLEMFPEISEDMEALSELYLDGTAIKELPSSIDRLRRLELLSMINCTSLVYLPDSICNLANLTYLNLGGCSNLDKFPEISEITEALSELNLYETAIEEPPSSIERLQRLESLSMENCTSLVCLPESICKLANLICLNLSGCSNLDKFPEISETMEALAELKLDRTAIKELPSSIERLRRLEYLSMKCCTRLECLPDGMCNLAELKSLALYGCSKLHNLPENFGSLESLLELQVYTSGLEQLPVSILRLKLSRLSFNSCKQMVAPLSSWPSSIEDCCTVVLHLDFTDCNLLELSDAIAHFSSLKTLRLSRNNLDSLPATMNTLVCLQQLELEGCKRLKSIPELSSSISYINADDCTALETVSTPKCPYDISRCFTFSNCSKLVQNDLFRDIVETHSPPQGNYSQSFYMCFPGSEMPEQFIHQCRGSSVTTQLPPNWFDNKFLGFAICAVTNNYKQAIDYDQLSVRCLCTFKGDHCEYRFSFYLFHRDFHYNDFRWLESNHMFLGYVPWSEFCINGEEVDERCYSEAKFEIQLVHFEGLPFYAVWRQSFHPSIERCDPCIERCGVQFFFANNEEVVHQDFVEPMVHSEEGCSAEPSGSAIRSDTSDVDEQYLKLSELFGGANINSIEGYIESDCEIEDHDPSGKREILSRWTQQVKNTSGLMQGDLNDGFSWTQIECSNMGDGYFRTKYDCPDQPSCWAKSKLRISIDDPTILDITYIGRHTCWETLPMLTHQVKVTPGMEPEGPFDGFSWGKYGQMDLPGARYPRVYYVCIPQNVRGCMAIKEVQLSDDDPTILKITYRGRHTCIQASTITSRQDKDLAWILYKQGVNLRSLKKIDFST